MRADPKLEKMVARLERLLEAKFGASRGPLRRRIAAPGRLLPGKVRRDLDQVERAWSLAGHPKLGRQIDLPQTLAAGARAEDWLKTVDVRDRRIGRLLGLLGGLAFNLILLFALVLAVLLWRGFL
ncbi:hypothetical protein LR948_07180 [Roseivivax sp. GX 12232]|uniref:hypothetical protein n=1 Tax=Roseivivax sp. GX 12232 TaxID=2900547 RepID=UPI001E52DEF2|nr:hypothetical protein [Roseivivax sp. GX 12232]MCE0505129.1 hypothetical protein [Roseivivax sp. GX 12232]